jgi:hypothetical protein
VQWGGMGLASPARQAAKAHRVHTQLEHTAPRQACHSTRHSLTGARQSHNKRPARIKPWKPIHAAQRVAGRGRVCMQSAGHGGQATVNKGRRAHAQPALLRTWPNKQAPEKGCRQKHAPAMFTNPNPLGRPVSRSVMTRALRNRAGSERAHDLVRCCRRDEGSLLPPGQATVGDATRTIYLTTGPQRENSRVRACSST